VSSESNYTFEDYQNCELFDVHRWSDYPEVIAVRKQIMDELGFKGSKKELNHVMVVLLNLYHAYSFDPDRWVMYSRDRNGYNEGTRYNKLHIRYDNMIKTVDGLIALEYVEAVPGFNDRRPGGKSYAPRMKATKKLIDVIQQDNKVSYEMIGKWKDDELIVLRDTDGEDIDYVDTKAIREMRAVLKDYNKLLSETYIDLHFEIADIQDLIDNRRKKINKKTGNPKDYSLYLNLSKKIVRRIFNKSTFSKGGRFYGGWWQNIPSRLRQRIIIDRYHTIEIDYSGFHIYLLYALKGIDYSGLAKEPYIYPKDNDPDNLRSIFKTMLLAAVNSKTTEECVKAVRYEINMNKDDYPEEYPDLKELYERFKKWHPDIEDYFNSSMGLELQNIDSDIAEEVVRIMTRESIPILVVHDSFVCSKTEESFLQEVMSKVYERQAIDLGIQGDLLNQLKSAYIKMDTKDITLKLPESQREDDTLMDIISRPDSNQACQRALNFDPP